MAALLTTAAPPPGLQSGGERPDVHNAYFAITIDAAVDLLEAREYQGLPRADRMAKALSEQQGFLNGFFDPALRAALDLRIVVDQQAATPITVGLIGRVWGADRSEVAAKADRLCAQLHASLPRHVTGAPVPDEAAVRALLMPFADGAAESAMITRHELIGKPSRPDAQVSYYFSAVPFNWADSDWSAVYAALAACSSPLVVSAATATPHR